MASPRSTFGASPPGGAASGPAEPVPRRPPGLARRLLTGCRGFLWSPDDESAAMAPAGRGTVLMLAGSAAQAGLFDDEEARKAILDLRARIQATDEPARKAAERTRRHECPAGASRWPRCAQPARAEHPARGPARRGGQAARQRRAAAARRGRRCSARRRTRTRTSTTGCASSSRRRCRWTAASSPPAPRRRKAYDDGHRRHPQRRLRRRGHGADRLPGALADQRLRRLGRASGSAMRCTASATTRARSAPSAPSSTPAPEHPKAPEALLALANSQAEMKDNRSARAHDSTSCSRAYPESEAAAAGKERLAALK